MVICSKHPIKLNVPLKGIADKDGVRHEDQSFMAIREANEQEYLDFCKAAGVTMKLNFRPYYYEISTD